MDRGLIFPHPAERLIRGRRRVRERRGVGFPVPQGRRLDRKRSRSAAAKNPAGTNRRPVPQSDTGVPGENPQAFGRTLVKELGKMAPYPRYKGRSPQGEPQRIGSGDCLPKTQDSANSQEDV